MRGRVKNVFSHQTLLLSLSNVRANIYAFNNGRVVNLPKDLGQKQKHVAEQIIRGEVPIVPDDMQVSDGNYVLPSFMYIANTR